MKALLFSLISVFFVAAVGCDKKKDNDYKKKNYLRGRLFLLDTLTQNSRYVPLAGRKVVLAADATDSLNYLYSDSTDKEGYFSFVLFSDAQRYFLLRFEDTAKGYYYYDTAVVEKGTDNALLVAILDEKKQNGFYFTTKENNLGVLPEVTFRLYSSEGLAKINSPQDAIETLTTDKYGRLFKANLPQGIYYVNAEKKIDTATWQVLAKPVTIHAKGFTTEDIVLTRKVNVFNNGFIIALKDSANNLVSGATVHLYSNQVAATSNNPAFSIASFTADNLGIISQFNLPAGLYYLNAFKNVEQTTLYRQLKEITLTTSNVVTDTMLLKK